MRNLRLSTMSARAPAGRANRNIGNVVATCTIETMNGSGLSVVMSQPDAALYIQLPMFANTVAVQSTENVAWRNGFHGDVALDAVEGGEELVFKLSPQIGDAPRTPTKPECIAFFTPARSEIKTPQQAQPIAPRNDCRRTRKHRPPRNRYAPLSQDHCHPRQRSRKPDD